MNYVNGLFGTISQQVSKLAYINPEDEDVDTPYEKAVHDDKQTSNDNQTATKDNVTEPSVDHPDQSKMQHKPDALDQLDKLSSKAVDTAKNLGNTLLGLAAKATHKVSEKAGQTILKDFDQEQEKFIEERSRNTHSAAAIPPWVGYNEEAVMRKQILALSLDSRNFLRDPPVGIEFQFDFNSAFPVALATLEEDPNLKKMRFELVPKQIKEERFWRNYFYRVSLIKQSTQLTTIARSDDASPSRDVTARFSPSTSGVGVSGSSQSQTSSDVPGESSFHEPSHNSAHDDFLSDAASAEPAVSEDELQTLREQLGIETGDAGDRNKSLVSPRDPGEDWERELVAELNEYELVTEQTGKTDEEWEQEISELLQSEDVKVPTESKEEN